MRCFANFFSIAVFLFSSSVHGAAVVWGDACGVSLVYSDHDSCGGYVTDDGLSAEWGLSAITGKLGQLKLCITHLKNAKQVQLLLQFFQEIGYDPMTITHVVFESCEVPTISSEYVMWFANLRIFIVKGGTVESFAEDTFAHNAGVGFLGIIETLVSGLPHDFFIPLTRLQILILAGNQKLVTLSPKVFTLPFFRRLSLYSPLEELLASIKLAAGFNKDSLRKDFRRVIVFNDDPLPSALKAAV